MEVLTSILNFLTPFCGEQPVNLYFHFVGLLYTVGLEGISN